LTDSRPLFLLQNFVSISLALNYVVYSSTPSLFFAQKRAARSHAEGTGKRFERRRFNSN
jgi:hypothetical protein